MQKIDFFIVASVIVLMIIGAIFSYSLPVFLENYLGVSQYHFFIRYVGFSIIGTFIMLLIASFDPDEFFDKFGWSIFIGSAVLVLLTFFLPDSFVPTIKGARRWIDLGIVKIAPVELFKIGMVYFLAFSFSRKMINKSFKEEILRTIPYIFLLGFFWLFIIGYQSDLGQVVVMVGVFILMLIAAGGKFQTVGILSFIGILIFTIAIIIKPYRIDRITNWLSKMHQIFFNTNTSYKYIPYSQIQESLNAIYHGGIIGQGIGNGVFKLGFLSDVHTDFVLAGIAEESGMLGIGTIIALMLFLIYRIFKVAYRSENTKYQLFAFGIGSLIAIQFLINALGIISIIPLKGLTVPFISYGGSSLIGFCVGIGMVLMISKKAKM